jgi:hypothetical protein
LSQNNKISYLKWYCHCKNSNILWVLCPQWLKYLSNHMS